MNLGSELVRIIYEKHICYIHFLMGKFGVCALVWEFVYKRCEEALAILYAFAQALLCRRISLSFARR